MILQLLLHNSFHFPISRRPYESLWHHLSNIFSQYLLTHGSALLWPLSFPPPRDLLTCYMLLFVHHYQFFPKIFMLAGTGLNPHPSVPEAPLSPLIGSTPADPVWVLFIWGSWGDASLCLPPNQLSLPTTSYSSLLPSFCVSMGIYCTHVMFLCPRCHPHLFSFLTRCPFCWPPPQNLL